MSAGDHYHPPTDPEELTRLGAMLAQSFGFPPGDAVSWFGTAGLENLRCLRRDGTPAAALILIPMGQYWGGRSVSMMGIAGVAVAPHVRGQGAGTGLLLSALREARDDGYALATLFPTTQPLYRGVGFEQAGARHLITGPLSALPAGDRALPVRPYTEADFAQVQAVYAAAAREQQGWLDRGHYVWTRVRTPRGLPCFGYVVGERDRVDGFVFYSLAALPGLAKKQELRISGWGATSLAAWRRLCGLLADHASMVCEIAWHGGLDDPLLMLAREAALQVRARDFWMLRVLDVRSALATRGYNTALRASLHLQLNDRSLPENSGAYVLHVGDGRAAVEPGGRGELQCDERGLAALYSGHRSARALQRLGMLDGPPACLQLADVLFCGTASLPDQF